MSTDKDYYSLGDIDTYLHLAYKLAKEVLAPTNDKGDQLHAQLVDGQVKTPPSFKNVYQKVMGAVIKNLLENQQENDKFSKEISMLSRAFQAYQQILSALQGYLASGKIPMMSPLFHQNSARNSYTVLRVAAVQSSIGRCCPTTMTSRSTKVRSAVPNSTS